MFRSAKPNHDCFAAFLLSSHRLPWDLVCSRLQQTNLMSWTSRARCERTDLPEANCPP